MPNLQFNQLTVISDTQKSGNQFQFLPKMNLITANGNSYGKSTLVKLLYWSLGCDPQFDSHWQKLDTKTILNFSIDQKTYQVSRYKNEIYIREENKDWHFYSKISGDYAKYFAELVGFKALLPNKNDATQLEVPPPAFYCLPYYIDQREGWSHCWQDFLSLAQYSNWTKPIIQYHTGYLSAHHFEIEKNIAERVVKTKIAQKTLEDIDTAINVIDDHIQPLSTNIALTQLELNDIEKDINADLTKLKAEQETVFNSLSNAQAERQFIISQLDIVLSAIQDIEEDYKFSIEKIKSDVLTCPLCGVKHDNSLINRTNILADKTKAEDQANNLQKRLTKLNQLIESLQKKMSDISLNLDVFNTKYAAHFEDITPQQNNDFSIIDIFASHSIKKYTDKTKIANQSIILDIAKKNRDDKKNQKKLLSKEKTEELNNKFTRILSNYINALSANGVDLEPLKYPWNYKKLYGSGGASESNRGILAYRFTILNMIESANNEVFAPVIVDTPRQNEPTDLNYEITLKFITDNIPSTAQLFVCALDTSEIKAYKNIAHTITLDQNQILSFDKYNELKILFKFHNEVQT